MILYHTSNVIVREPDVAYSRKHLDFGCGFYLTSIEKQAINYGRRFTLRGEPAIMNIYELQEVIPDVKRKVFNAYDGDWLDYITACRKNLPREQFDIIEGGIADDQVFDTVDLYLQGKYNRDQALQQLMWKKPNHQICIASQIILDNYLRFIDFISL